MKIATAVFALILALAAPSIGAEKAALAVLDFVARDVPREDAVKISLLIRNEMSNLPQYRMLDREQIVKALGADSSCDDLSCAMEAGKKLGARIVIVGSVMKFGDNLTVTGRVIDAENGTVLAAEKERAVFQADEFFMVERFCDRLARRMTGKTLYAVERAAKNDPDGGGSAISYRSSDYRPAADPTAWLALGAGIASGMGFLEATASFSMKKHSYHAGRMFCTTLWWYGSKPDLPRSVPETDRRSRADQCQKRSRPRPPHQGLGILCRGRYRRICRTHAHHFHRSQHRGRGRGQEDRRQRLVHA